MAFADRRQAGQQLATALAGYRDRRPVVLALPRGGVPVAAEVAAALHAPLDLILVRKIGVPGHHELAMGAVSDGGQMAVVRNEDIIGLAGVDEAGFNAVRDRELAELERRRRCYLGDRPPIDITGRLAIVVDDGIATGATTRAALRAVRTRGPDTVVLAVPVAPAEAVAALRAEVDDLICLEIPEPFYAIGVHYRDFAQVGDDEVRRLLARQSPENS